MATLFIFARLYSTARFAVLTSWMVAFGTAGNVIGAAPLANAVQAFGWRPVMAGLGVITFAVALAMLALVKDPVRPAGMHAESVCFAGFRDLLRMRVLWPIIPLTALNYAPAAGIRGLWAGPYLADVYGADALIIGRATLFMALAMIAGSFVYGPLDTIFRTRKWVAVVGNAFSLAAIAYLAIFTVTSVPETTVALVIIGMCAISMP